MQRMLNKQLAKSNGAFERTPSAALPASPHWSACMSGSRQRFTPLLQSPIACHKRKLPAGVTLNFFIRTTMRLIASIIIILTLSSCTNRIQQYPTEWPIQPVMSKDCSEVSGKYIEAEPTALGAAPPGVWAFMFPHSKVRLKDNTVKLREMSVYFDTDRLLHVDYIIDGVPVASKTFTSSEYVCEKSGLRLTINKRTGEVFDKVPNWGANTITAVMFRVNDYLYVKSTWDTKALIFYIIPDTAYSEWWSRFLVHQP